MATVDLATVINNGRTPVRHGQHLPYYVETEIDIAAAVTSKGSALAANDVIFCIDIPAETMILSAGVEVTTATSGGTVTIDLGTGVDVDVFADGFDIDDGTAAGTYSQLPAAFQPVMCQAADTLDITWATQSGTATSTGKLRVFALLMDCAAEVSAGVA